MNLFIYLRKLAVADHRLKILHYHNLMLRESEFVLIL